MMDINFIDVVKTFNKTRVLNEVTLSISSGSVFGLLGPNGAGKTTLLKILLNLLRQDEGTVLINSLNVDAVDRRKISSLLENDGLFPYLTCYENLEFTARLYGIQDSRARINSIQSSFGLGKFSSKLVSNLSHGMRRKCALASAFLPAPHLIILDEPTNGLDPESKEEVHKYVEQVINDNTIVILATHDYWEFKRICKYGIILSDGKLKDKIVASEYTIEELHGKYMNSIAVA